MKRTKRQNPTTRSEWRKAVDAAHTLLVVDAARQYGLTTGGPQIDIERCEQILREGTSRGIKPAADAVERVLSR